MNPEQAPPESCPIHTALVTQAEGPSHCMLSDGAESPGSLLLQMMPEHAP